MLTTKLLTAVTNRNETSQGESLLTVSLPAELHSSVVAYQRKSGIASLSEAIRSALDGFEGDRTVGRRPSRQVSFACCQAVEYQGVDEAVAASAEACAVENVRALTQIAAVRRKSESCMSVVVMV